MGKVQRRSHRSSNGTKTKSLKENKTKVDDCGYFETHGKKDATKKIM